MSLGFDDVFDDIQPGNAEGDFGPMGGYDMATGPSL